MQQNDNGKEERVVVTGTGVISALGHNVTDTWSAILASKSGFGEITLFGDGQHSTGGACEVKDFDPAAYLGKRNARRRDRYQQLAAVAAIEAMEQSGLQVTDENCDRHREQTNRRDSNVLEDPLSLHVGESGEDDARKDHHD